MAAPRKSAINEGQSSHEGAERTFPSVQKIFRLAALRRIKPAIDRDQQLKIPLNTSVA